MLMPSFMDSRSDILSTMRTCRTLYRGGVPALLQQHPVRLGVGSDEHESRFASFYSFMMNESTGNRFRFLQHLLVYASGKIRGNTSRMLIEIFQKAADHLQSLDLPNSETLLSDDQNLSAAISTLRNLKSIKASDGSERSLTLLQQLCSSLLHVDLSSNSKLRNPISLLSEFHTTLQEIRITGVELPPQLSPFPHVRTLQVSDTDTYPLALLAHLFPNLKRLTAAAACSPAFLVEDDVSAIRNANARGQKDISWRELDYLSGDCFDLFVLAIKCPVRVLEVLNVGSSELFMLSAAINDNRPVCLRVSVDCRRLYLASLSALFRSVPSRLTLTFSLDHADMEVSSITVSLDLLDHYVHRDV